jgi:hypothetical protein
LNALSPPTTIVSNDTAKIRKKNDSKPLMDEKLIIISKLSSIWPENYIKRYDDLFKRLASIKKCHFNFPISDKSCIFAKKGRQRATSTSSY